MQGRKPSNDHWPPPGQRPLLVSWPPPELSLPPDEVLESLDQAGVLPMDIDGALVAVPVTSNDTIRKEPKR